jgi:methylmalonyl-CoA epimerase
LVRIRRIHHVTVAVRDLDRARETFGVLFGAPSSGASDIAAFGARAAQLPLGGDMLELATPLDAGSALMRFLERRGEGVYTIALEVDDLDAAVAELAARGVRASRPVEARPGVRSAFVSMTVTHGLSIELVELAGAAARDARAPAPPPPAPAPGDGAPPAPSAAASAATEATEKPLRDLTPDEWDWSDEE